MLSSAPNSIASKSTKRKLTNRVIIVVVVLVAMVLAALVFMFVIRPRFSATSSSTEKLSESAQAIVQANEQLLDGDAHKAIASARQAVAKDPQNLFAIEGLANLLKATNPKEAQKLFNQAYLLYKKQNGIDEGSGTVLTYAATAAYAKRANLDEQAKKYYQKVIELANQSDPYDKSLAERAKQELEKL